MAEYSASGALLRRYVHGPGVDEPLLWYEGAGLGDRRGLLANHQGSVIGVTNASGALLFRNTYEEYGSRGPSNSGARASTSWTRLPKTCRPRKRRMPEGRDDSSAAMKRTIVERKSERELVVTRTFNAPARVAFEAWSKAELFRRWWVPKAMSPSLRSCDLDMRSGGGYRLVFRFPDSDQTMVFFGTYAEVVPNTRIVWTNDESDQGAVTTVTFEEHAGKTQLTLHELYPTKAALDEALAGPAEGLPEQFAQLDELLAAAF